MNKDELLSYLSQIIVGLSSKLSLDSRIIFHEGTKATFRGQLVTR